MYSFYWGWFTTRRWSNFRFHKVEFVQFCASVLQFQVVLFSSQFWWIDGRQRRRSPWCWSWNRIHHCSVVLMLRHNQTPWIYWCCWWISDCPLHCVYWSDTTIINSNGFAGRIKQKCYEIIIVKNLVQICHGFVALWMFQIGCQ